ncbi:glycosyltransferase family 2 protein [Methylobacterium nonmethylotrophicum]|uniref:Glycosyltransferase family 2 protein n=1 Tax=Methylobacterium nonmethylotrophicum TaxID=1141884 RepID=A0A4Z0NS84_9HYPH|nr:glycosyltransferase family 2 protein [Methylobacterium nonmethylotrophicum]TGD99495.1 glycosyltransferase family 2 protein [Methylobacterium nonmethylotrophicum]
MPPALDVVIVNWNGGALLRACLASLAAAESALGDDLALRVVVVDNASTDGSLDDLPLLRHGPEVIANPDNQGFGRACNAGAARGRAPAILFLNPDARVTAGSLAGAHAALMADPGTGIVGARLLDEDGRVQRSCARRPTAGSLIGQALLLDRARLVPSHFMTEWDHGEDRAVDQVMGAFLMIRRPLFASLGGFDERFFVYYEDVDLCARAWGAGAAVRHLAGISVRHEGQGTTRAAKAHRLACFLESQIRYAAKHHGRATALALVATAFGAQVPLRLAQALARRSGPEAGEVLRGAGLLARALPGLLRSIGRPSTA